MILMLQPVSALKFTHSLVGEVRVLEKGVRIEIYGYHFGIIFSQIQRYVAYNIRIVNSSSDRSDKANSEQVLLHISDEPMSIEMQVQLGAEEIAALSSVYIDKGIKQEAWQIQNIVIDGNRLDASVSMTSYFISPTDSDGFHMSIFCTQEILAQLANIYLHVAAGLKVKSRETWMRDCRFTYRKVIRNGENIKVEMDIVRQRWVGESLLVRINCRITDGEGGLFTASMKGMMR